jgi:WD40 repeat protein
MPPNNDWWVVLADFGISRRVDSCNEITLTDDFLGPELRLGNQDTSKHSLDFKATDMWALGEIVVRMLNGEATFENPQEFTKYCSGDPFPFERFSRSTTADAKDFISRLMAVNISDRLTASQGIAHPWISAQRMSLVDELASMSMGQTSPVELPAKPVVLPSASRINLSESERKASGSNLKRKSINFSSSLPSGSAIGEEKEVALIPSLDAEGKQVCPSPCLDSDGKQVLPGSLIEPEEKQVLLDPRADMEDKQVVHNASIFRNKGIAQDPLILSKSPIHKLEGHTLPVKAIAFSPDGEMLASASDDGTIKLWDGQPGAPPQTLKGHTYAVNAVAFSPDGKTLVSASAEVNGTIKLWDCGSGAEQQKLKYRTMAVNTLTFSPNGEMLASASILDDGAIILWDCQTGAMRKTLIGHWLNVNTVAFSPDGKTVASASHDGYVKLWDAQSGKTLQSLWGYSQWVNAVALEPAGIRAKTFAPAGIRDVVYSPDGNLVASAADDGLVRIWDSRSGAAVKTLKRQWRWATVSPVGINTVAFSPAGMTLASASDDGVLKLWDMRTGAILQTIKAHSKWISDVTFTPEGKTLASASHDGTIKLWG